VTLNTIVRAGKAGKLAPKGPVPFSRRWPGLLVTLAFVAVCLAYYLVCRRLSMAIEWVFLMGFLPSWVVALPAAFKLHDDRPVWREALWAAGSFTALFWSAGGFILWKAATLG
jgi:hypothetical protein